MEHTKLPLTTWFLAMYWMTQSKNRISALALMRHVGVSYPTAWLLRHKLMQVMRLLHAPVVARARAGDAAVGAD